MSSSKVEKREVNTCLMTNSDIEEVNFFQPYPLYKHLEIEFDNILNDSNILSKKYLFIKNQFYEIKKENEMLQIKNDEYLKIIQNMQLTHNEMPEKHKNLNEGTSEVHSQNPCETQKENNTLKTKFEELTNDITIFIKSTETLKKSWDLK